MNQTSESTATQPARAPVVISERMLSAAIKGALLEMESHEDWVHVEPEYLQRVDQLLAQLKSREGMATLLAGDDVQLDHLIRVIAYVCSSASVEIMHRAGQYQPGLGGDMARRAESNVLEDSELASESRVILDRITMLARANCYERVFGPERRRQVLALLRKDEVGLSQDEALFAPFEEDDETGK